MGVLTNTRRVIKAGFINFWRNAVVSLSAIFVMTVALFVIAATLLSSVFLESSLQEIRDKVDINVYFTSDAPEGNILEVRDSIAAMPEVASVEYVSRDQAIENFKKRHENDYLMTQALEELADNPLGAIINIKAKDPAQFEAIAKHVDELSSVSASDSGRIISSVNYNKNKVVIDKLTAITRGVESVSMAILIALAVIAVVITFNTIRLAIYISREEIAIMRLVGANNSFVRGPFVVEGIMYGAVSAIFATALCYPATLWLRDATSSFYGGIDVFSYYLAHLNEIFFLLLGSGCVLGAVSSYLAVRRYLKV